MTEDQSVVGRRRIYYDQTGGEALICSDSEEEAIDDEEEKRDFLEPEDYIIRMTLEQLGLSDSVLAELASFLSRSTSEIKVSTTFFSAYCLCELSCAIFFRIKHFSCRISKQSEGCIV
jgi:hypothetical protein